MQMKCIKCKLSDPCNSDDWIDKYNVHKRKVYLNKYDFFDKHRYMSKRIYNILFYDLCLNCIKTISTDHKFNRNLRNFYKYVIRMNYCIKCKLDYSVDVDPFIEIYDSISENNITFKLCLKCVKKYASCTNCDYMIDGPYNQFYVSDNYNRCYYCHNNLPIPECNKQQSSI